MVTTFHYLLLGAALFTIGVIGVLTRRNIMIILMSIELMMNAVNINLIAFSNRLQQVTGQVFAIFVITVAAAEAAVGLGIVIAMFKNKETNQMPMGQMPNAKGHIDPVFHMTVGIWPIDSLAFGSPICL